MTVNNSNHESYTIAIINDSQSASYGLLKHSILTQRYSCTLHHIQGVFNTHSKAFPHTQLCSGDVQHSLKSVDAHSIVFRGCSHSLKGIHVHSIVFRGCSHLLKGIHVHSISIQGVFNCVPYSLKGA